MRSLISIFIVNFNTSFLLEKCLESIFGSALCAADRFDLEVFIADNNSTDGSQQMVQEKFPSATLMAYSKNMGYTRAINPLLCQAKGDYFLILHPDVELSSETLICLLDFFDQNPTAGIAGGNLYYPDGTPNPCEIGFPSFRNELLWFWEAFSQRIPWLKTSAGKPRSLDWPHERTQRVNWVWNACMMVRRDVLTQIGYFDEDYFVWFSDWDFCTRAAAAGWGAYYVREALAVHHERQSFAASQELTKEIRYKIDGWYSAPAQMRDRNIFLRKHLIPGARMALKSLYILENIVRLAILYVSSIGKREKTEETIFPARACLKTIRAILE